ncbi:MAG: nuclear transport factor 2 family protein [Synergistaceae bacterium]|jgi:ketosteroid isomerase-like protein|nr:nuclear transport factor 2 family protein [Synergistaceae bacterium]
MIINHNIEKDKEILLSIIDESSKSMTGAQSTKHWTNNTIWFDIPPFASKGVKPACKIFDDAFSQLKSIDVEILQTETFINGDMGVVCSVQRWNITWKDGTVKPPMLVRQTNCFERQNGQWKIIHEHSSIPAASGWDGKIISEE